MDFAKKQLEKYGWTEGEGIGKEGTGITKAIKANLKNDNQGLGFDQAKDLTDPWWSKVYEDCAKRIEVDNSAVDSNVTFKDDPQEKGDRPIHMIAKRMYKANFTDFKKGETLNNGEIAISTKIDSESSSDSEEEDSSNISSTDMDKKLLKACGGRTAHHAARFGSKLSGKLARLEAQEKLIGSHSQKIFIGVKRKVNEVIQDQDDNNLGSGNKCDSDSLEEGENISKFVKVQTQTQDVVEVEDDSNSSNNTLISVWVTKR